MSALLNLFLNSKYGRNLLQISIIVVPVGEGSLTLTSSASSAIRFLFLDSTCFIVEHVLPHTLLTDFQKLSAVSNTVSIAQFLLRDVLLLLINYLLQGWEINPA